MTKEQIEKRLLKVEMELRTCRTSTIQDGWQTQRFARKSRKWDYYGREKMILLGLLDDLNIKNYAAV